MERGGRGSWFVLFALAIACQKRGDRPPPPAIVPDAGVDAVAQSAPCAYKLDIPFASDWSVTNASDDECRVYKLGPTVGDDVVMSVCAGPPPAPNKPFKARADLGDAILGCNFSGRGDRLVDLACQIVFPARGWMPYVELTARRMRRETAEKILEVARTPVRHPVVCERGTSYVGCLECFAIQQGLAERKRVFRDDDLLGRGAVASALPAPAAAGASVPFEPWCYYTASAPPNGRFRLDLDGRPDRDGCDVYSVKADGQLVVRARACPAERTEEPGMPTERRTFRWELPQGRFTVDLSFVSGDRWALQAHLRPDDVVAFPRSVQFASVAPIERSLLGAVVGYLSTIDIAPALCSAERPLCGRCDAVLATRRRVASKGVLGPVE
jgi:hypothetical protein